MRVLISNNCGHAAKEMYARYPKRIGWLLSPSSWKNPFNGMHYALDNDAYSAWVNKTQWNEERWISMLEKAAKMERPPDWVLVPDEVGSAGGTLAKWDTYAPVVKGYGFTLAFAVQDGMKPSMVPREAQIVFVGGTTTWKWSTLPVWASFFPRVHVGRVRQRRLLTCEEAKVESCDGTGWFREGQTGKPARYLWAWLHGQIGKTQPFEFYDSTANKGH